MKPNQQHTPKYWVAHRTDSDNVYLSTASKVRSKTFKKLNQRLEDDAWKYLENGTISIDLVEINLIDLSEFVC